MIYMCVSGEYVCKMEKDATIFFLGMIPRCLHVVEGLKVLESEQIIQNRAPASGDNVTADEEE